MSALVPIVMFGWIPIGLVLFALFPARRAVVAGFVAASLLLPATGYRISGFPDYTKISAACGVVFLGAAVFDLPKLLRFRASWRDAPAVLFCLSPFVSSLTNGLGWHDAFSVVFAQAITWGVPFYLGRMYCGDLQGLKELAAGLFAGGAAYAPLVLIESWTGPIFSRWIYAFEPSTRDTRPHFGGPRPMVFMEGGLMVSAWMTFTAIAAIWLWRTSAREEASGKRYAWLAPLTIAGAIATRSLNAWFLLVAGAGILFAVTAARSKVPVVCVVALISIFLGVRATGLWSGGQAVPIVSKLVNPERAQSLNYRLENEQILSANARTHALFGWGRQAAGFYDQRGTWTVPDSLWIITFVQSGVVGLAALFALLLLPVIVFLRQFPATGWSQSECGPAAALAVILILYTVDNLFNASLQPILMLAAGGLVSNSRADGRAC